MPPSVSRIGAAHQHPGRRGHGPPPGFQHGKRVSAGQVHIQYRAVRLQGDAAADRVLRPSAAAQHLIPPVRADALFQRQRAFRRYIHPMRRHGAAFFPRREKNALNSTDVVVMARAMAHSPSTVDAPVLMAWW